MKRRDFLVRSAAAALAGSVPLGAAGALRGPLLEDPLAWVGASFRTSEGAVLQLGRVEQLVDDARSTQFRLQFRTLSGAAPGEGTHALACGWREEVVFLQSGREGPVACVNRLHGGA